MNIAIQVTLLFVLVVSFFGVSGEKEDKKFTYQLFIYLHVFNFSYSSDSDFTMRKTWEQRRQIIKFKVSPRRKNKSRQSDSISRSEYAKELFKIGVVWDE